MVNGVNTGTADIANRSTFVGRSAQKLSTLTQQFKGMVDKFKVQPSLRKAVSLLLATKQVLGQALSLAHSDLTYPVAGGILKDSRMSWRRRPFNSIG